MKAAPPGLAPDSGAETEAVIREARRRQRRRYLLIGLTVVVLAGAAGVTVSQIGPGGQPPAHGGPRHPVARPRPRIVPPSARWTATVQARIPIPVSQEGGIAVLGSIAWVAEWDNGLVVRVDLAARRVTKVLHIGSANGGGPISIAAGSGSVWVLNFSTGRLLRIDPVTGAVTDRIQIPGATSVAYGDGFVWVTGFKHSLVGLRLYKIDPSRNVIVRSRSILPGSHTDAICPVSPGPQGLWLGCARAGGITLIDPASLKPLKASPGINDGGYGLLLIAPRQHVVWVLSGAGLFRVSTVAARITARVKINWDTANLPFQDSAFAVDQAGRVWVANSALDVLAPGSRVVRQVANTVGTNIINVVTAGSHLWADTGLALEELNVHQVLAKP